VANLEQLLLRRPPDQQRHVRDRLAILDQSNEVRKQAVKNLWFDTRPPEGAWNAMIDAIVSVSGVDPAYIEEAIRSAFRGVILQADPVSCGTGTHFGRAVPFERLADEIYTPASGVSAPGRKQHARRWLRHVLRGEFSLARKLWRTRKLGRYVMWSTFEVGSNEPFGPPPRRALRIRADLGLHDEAGDLVLLTFELSNVTTARFPTVVEAYASSIWPYHFSPAVPGASCGMTLPWSEGGTGVPRKEVVHEPIAGVMLTRKPERAR